MTDPTAPLGNPPHISVKLDPMVPGDDGFEVALSLTTLLGELRQGLCLKCGVPVDGVRLMHDGMEIDDAKTLEGNNVTLPGPAARRRGQGPVLRFDLDRRVLDAVRQRREEEEKNAAAAASLIKQIMLA